MKGKPRAEMGLQCFTTTEPITAAPPLTPSRVFEEDIYKPLVWQWSEGRLSYLPDLSSVTEYEAGCDDKSDRVRADGAQR